jgi:hypothetical protein
MKISLANATIKMTNLEGYPCTFSPLVEPGDTPVDHLVKMADHLLFDVVCQVGWQCIVVDLKLLLLA